MAARARALVHRTAQAWKALPGEDKYFAKGVVCAVPLSVLAGSVALADLRDLPSATMVGVMSAAVTVVGWPAVVPVVGLVLTLHAIERKMYN